MPELQPRGQGGRWSRDIRVQFSPPRTQEASGTLPSPLTWPAGASPVFECRIGDSLLIRVPGLADFLVNPPDDSILCTPTPAANPANVRHFLLNQVGPRLVSVRDPLVIHASAVATGCGTFALIGPSGIGKSTLAASFGAHAEGSVIADDAILVSLSGGMPTLVGGYRCSRLHADSITGIGLEANSDGEHQPAAKRTLRLDRTGTMESAPTAARAFFVLTSVETDQAAIAIETLSGMAAVMALIPNIFLFAPEDAGLVRNRFEAAAALARSGCHIYSLRYPRRFALLSEVRARVVAVLNQQP